LPEMDGLAICRNVRLVSDVPIIMISARKEDTDKVEGLDRGADDYLAKPFSLAELKARVTSQLRRWRRYQGEEEVSHKDSYVQGLTIDWDKEIVTRSEAEVLLTPKEFEMLKLMAKHPNRIFTKEELYERLKQDQVRTKEELKQDQNELYEKLKIEISNVKKELKAEIRQVQDEINNRFDKLTEEISTEILETGKLLYNKFEDLESKMQSKKLS